MSNNQHIIEARIAQLKAKKPKAKKMEIITDRLPQKEITRFKRDLKKESEREKTTRKPHAGMFKKGVSGNPAGRGSASVSIKSRIIKEFAADILSGGMIKFKHELAKLKGRAYLDVYLELMQYSVAKLQRVESTNINIEAKEPQQIQIGESIITIN